jgi:2,5-diketo-D-gluconate reductase B
MEMPRLGLGTYGRTGEDGFDAIMAAIELGYRHLDTAQTYGTESIVGRAIVSSGLPRSQLFVTTKVADTNLSRRDFLPSVRASLDELELDRVDLLLIHWPVPETHVPLAEYLDSLAEAQVLGLTRLIGVSNFPSALLARAVERLGPGRVATNQVECHPFLQNRLLREACAAHAVTLTAYMPLAVGRVMHDPVLRRIADRRDETPAAVSLAWLLAKGVAAIPASTNRGHLASNLRALDLDLTSEEVAEIDALDRGERLVNPAKSPVWD